MHIGEPVKRIISEPIELEDTWRPAKPGDTPGDLIPGEDEESTREEEVVEQPV